MAPDIFDAANNAVAVASVAYALDPCPAELSALEHVVALAHEKGLTVAELCDASGLDEPFVRRLLGGETA